MTIRKVALLCTLAALSAGCVALRAHDREPFDASTAGDSAPLVPAPASIDYGTRYVGRLDAGGAAFADRVARALARDPALAGATLGDGAPLHLDFTLTNTTNRLVAGLTGIASGLSLTLLPAYARDDFELVVELRAAGAVAQRLEYRDAVTTLVHLVAVFASSSSSRPRVVVEGVVDDMLSRALRDLDASGALAARSSDAAARPHHPGVDVVPVAVSVP